MYQTLVNKLPPLNIWASKEEALWHLKEAYSKKSSGIHQWKFANRISYNIENQLEIMQHCLSTLYAKVRQMYLFYVCKGKTDKSMLLLSVFKDTKQMI